MARPGRPERNRVARSFRQLRRFRHVIKTDRVFGIHKLKMLSLEVGESLQTLVVGALNDLMVKYRKKPVIAGPSEDED